ncbi:hypothetical protein C6H88_02095 [Chlamydia muridarum str. Nigg]|uniref:Membrane protein n=2 Tax=Chlamydia muridarum TaxID=83560 RepID=A0A069ZTC4_CHLMR|nr:hypothetical protein [Chlamydia muridarum]UFT29162.1 hypothetical protein FTN71_02180 [Chlamydia trachomatis]AAF39267.1 hypothetical protein TC_0411 [Chlamydia muridarum str. Nigg]AHH22796.1 membrane protein [Chlamydia muridarum str. Nigg3 CMUT3-5]AHH23721.1 membrane protein [Chlamydia muridarum str. Nigg CM972]AID37935.1 membrane protein [Chlamydia muridarum str. Nigg 2 MCR]
MACCVCVYGYNEICYKETVEKAVAVAVDCVLFNVAAVVATLISAVFLLIRWISCAIYNCCSTKERWHFLPTTESRIEWLTLIPILGPLVVASVVYAKAREDGYCCLDSLVCAMQSPWMLLDSIRQNRNEPEWMVV